MPGQAEVGRVPRKVRQGMLNQLPGRVAAEAVCISGIGGCGI